jgi:pyridoxal phosphate enzyme (YggS family)
METTALRAMIAANLARARQTIADTAAGCGRRADEVRLIAVSKTHSAEAIAAAMAAGQRVFGENTAQEALPKIARFPDQGLEWHFIGHLQSNKAKFIPGNFSWLHSLDSLKLAERLARFARDRQTTLNLLIEVNITRDPARHGVAPEAVARLLDDLLRADLAGLRLRGLMAIGPYPASPAEQHAAFAAVRDLRDACRGRFALPDFTELSMGMSGDYRAAIAEGATLIRIGSAIFGARDYHTPKNILNDY